MRIIADLTTSIHVPRKYNTLT